MIASVIVVFLLSAVSSLVLCADEDDYACYYDIFSNDTDPDNIEFYRGVEQLIKGLNITGSPVSNHSQTKEELSVGVDLYVDQNVTQILLMPENLDVTTLGNDNIVSESNTTRCV